jgi:CrcB protein
MPSVMSTALVALGGAIGSVARYWLVSLAAPVSRGMPWGTVLINILGSFAIGLFGTLTLSHGRYPAPESARLFFMVGVCGGFTTFSAFSLQTLDLLRAGAVGRALLNIAASVLLCLAAVALGHTLAANFSGGLAAVAQTRAEKDAS